MSNPLTIPLHPEVERRVALLRPCPFCSKPLIEAVSFRTRYTAYMAHEANGCVISSMNLRVRADLNESPDDTARELMWNGRGGAAFTMWEHGVLSNHVAAVALTYLGHKANAGLFPAEEEMLSKYEALGKKLAGLTPKN